MKVNMAAIDRTSCACRDCIDCCKRQPGPLAPGDLERIADRLGETPEEALVHFWASPGAVVADLATGERVRVGSITPRMAGGRCVFLSPQDHCTIHEVAPFGCANFDTHMGREEAMRRSVILVRLQASGRYQALRSRLPEATSYEPRPY